MHIPILSDLVGFFFPKRCALCQQYLVEGEETLCLVCQSKLPRVHAAKPDNEPEHRLFGRLDYEHGSSFCFYNKEGDFASLLQAAKYKNKPWYNQQLAKLYAVELQQESRDHDGVGWPYDIDVIVPVPVHWRRRLRRGYNQSEMVALGLAEVWHLPVESGCLYKCRYTSSQVGLSREERLAAETQTFAVRHSERLEGKHVLLVDDVMTTGGTLEACAEALKVVRGLRLSFVTLGLTS